MRGYWSDLSYQAKSCWFNPAWYLLLVLFVYGPIISGGGWNLLEWTLFHWIYAFVGPPLWLMFAVLYNRTRPR